ncbi:MAG: PstS family phosphate ABC transporter substrate-binding protein [Candidatus Binatia bacterium]
MKSVAYPLTVGVLLIAVIANAQMVKIDGSSTVYPITEAVAEEFQKANPHIRVTVGISGTGGGFKKFCRGDTDISDASRPIKKVEMAVCKKAGIQYIELPIAFDALTVVVHPTNSWAGTITVKQLKRIWEPRAQQKINRWNQVVPSWPSRPLNLYGPGVDSGTFDYFTEAVVGKAQASRGDYTASADPNVLVQGVANDPNALGFFGFAYYIENRKKLKAVAIHNGKKGIKPSRRTVENGSYQPFSRPIFIYVKNSALKKPAVKRFIEFYLDQGGSLASEVGYVKFTPKTYHQDLKRLREEKTGTVFGGKPAVGLSIEQLMKRELIP